MEEFERTVDLLTTELNQVKDPASANVDEKMSTKGQEDELQRLKDEYETIAMLGKTEYDQRYTNRKETDEIYKRKLK